MTERDKDRLESASDAETHRTPPAAESPTVSHPVTKISQKAEGKRQPSVSDGGSAHPSIFEGSDVPVVDLREVLAESGRGKRRARPGGASRAKRLGVLLLILAVASVTGIAALLASGASSDEPDGVSEVAVVPPTNPAPAPPAPDTPPSTVPTTTATTTATTAATTTPLLFIEPVGEGLDISDLALSALGIGPLSIGSDAEPVLGILTASLGQPDHDSGLFTSAGEYGTCVGDEVRTLGWGSLVVITGLGVDTGASFIGYALDARLPDAGGPEADLETLSGLRAGDTVATLRSIYEGRFELRFATHPVEGPIFEVGGNGGVLLWGPLSSTGPEGVVQGIFSPMVCAGS